MPSGCRERDPRRRCGGNVRFLPALAPSIDVHRRQRGRLRTLEKGFSPLTKAAACGAVGISRPTCGKGTAANVENSISSRLHGCGDVIGAAVGECGTLSVKFRRFDGFCRSSKSTKAQKTAPPARFSTLFILTDVVPMSSLCHPFCHRFVIGWPS